MDGNDTNIIVVEILLLHNVKLYHCDRILTFNKNMIPVHGKVYSIQHYVMNGFQWLAAGWWVFPVSATNKNMR